MLQNHSTHNTITGTVAQPQILWTTTTSTAQMFFRFATDWYKTVKTYDRTATMEDTKKNVKENENHWILSPNRLLSTLSAPINSRWPTDTAISRYWYLTIIIIYPSIATVTSDNDPNLSEMVDIMIGIFTFSASCCD